MAEYIAKRRLYSGNGAYVAKGDKIDLTPAEAERLAAAIEKPKAAVKKEAPLANKAEGASTENKAKK